MAERNLDYARKVGDELAAAGFRAEVDERQERMNAKLRDAQLQKIPYMLVVGNREEEARGVSVRLRTNENRSMTDLAEFVGTRERWLGQRVGCKGVGVHLSCTGRFKFNTLSGRIYAEGLLAEKGSHC